MTEHNGKVKQLEKAPLDWQVTPFTANPEGGWANQPVILVPGKQPLFFDTPEEYITELERMHDSILFARGLFHTVIGQLQDGLENAWEADSAKRIHRNGHK